MPKKKKKTLNKSTNHGSQPTMVAHPAMVAHNYPPNRLRNLPEKWAQKLSSKLIEKFARKLLYLCPSLPVEHSPSTTPAIALCSGLLLSFWTSWSPAVSALLQCLVSNCCEARLSSSSPAGSRSGLGMWCWMLASWGCVQSSPTSSAVSAWPLVPVLLAPTDIHFGLLPLDFVDAPQTWLRQVLKNVRIFRCIVCVVRHVSHPYSRTDFTLELKMRSLVLMLIPPDAQMFLSMTKAVLALPILAVTSRAVPPWWSTTLPR